MDNFKEQLTPTAILSAGLLLFCVWRTTFSRKSALPALPIIGYDQKQWFAWPRTLYFAYTNYRVLYQEAYDNYLSKGQPCIMPEPNDTHVVLPSTLSQWLCDQPDSILSASDRQNELLQSRYAFPIPKMAEKAHHMAVVKRDLTRRLNGLTGEIWDELEESFKRYWGENTEEWKEVNLMETMMRIVTRTSNRVFVGKEACRNEEYLDLCTSFAQDVPISSIIIRIVPGFLQPLLGPLIALPNRYHQYKIRRILAPEIQRRREIEESGDENPPNDFLQWFITYARNNLESEESTVTYLAARIATLNFAAIHTSTFSIVNAITDVVTSSDGKSLLKMLQAEIEQVMAEDGGQWNKTSVQRMVKTDSVLRESMRYSTFMTGALQRAVVAKEGITTPDGLHIKQGNWVEVPAWPRHLDSSAYPDANTFTPLRFVDTSTKENGNGTASNSKAKAGGGLSSVDTSPDFLTFSHGRHACPGRFFAANELKLALAYVAMYYEVEPQVVEPKAIAFGSFMAPNPKLSVRIRRKAKA